MIAVLVTGGAGYIGSHAAKTLATAGHDVVIYDNLSAGHHEAVATIKRSIAGRGNAGRVTLVEGDIRDAEKVRAALRESGATAVMHFAAWLSVAESVRDPIGYYRNNVGGALAVLEAMAAESVRHFVFSSTAAVFGEPIETPIAEAHPKRPINSYGETKLAIEHALPHFERAYGIRSICLRYFNAAGADPEGDLGEDHEPEAHLVPVALRAALDGPPLNVFGEDYPTPDGTCLRDFVHVTDLAAAHVLALQALQNGGASTTYNLGNGRPTSVRDVIAAVDRITGRRVRWTSAPRRPGDPAALFASSDRIKRELGWRPQFEDLDTIVRTAWQWFEAHPAGFAGGVHA